MYVVTDGTTAVPPNIINLVIFIGATPNNVHQLKNFGF
jgi:hypothetical protein